MPPSKKSSGSSSTQSSAALKSHLKAAKASVDRGDFEEALSHCKEALQIDKKCYHAYVLAGVASIGNGNLQRALQAYQRAISMRPELPLAHRAILDAFRDDDSDVSALGKKAAAHKALAEIANANGNEPDNYKHHLKESALCFHRAALKDRKLYIDHARAAWRALQESQLPNALPLHVPHVAYPLAELALTPMRETTEAGREESVAESAHEIGEALYEYAEAARDTGLWRCGDVERDDRYGTVRKALGQHVMKSVACGNLSLEDALRILHGAGEFDGALQLCELDQVSLSMEKLRIIAQKSVRMYPQAISLRARAALAGSVLFGAEQGRTDITAEALRRSARNFLGVAKAQLTFSAVSRNQRLGTQVTVANGSSINAFVQLMRTTYHLLAREYKLARQTASEGNAVATCVKSEEEGAFEKRYILAASIALTHANALLKMRDFPRALDTFQVVLRHVKEFHSAGNGHTDAARWLSAAAHKGVLIATRAAHGKKSPEMTDAIAQAELSHGESRLYATLCREWLRAQSYGELSACKQSISEVANSALEKAAALEKNSAEDADTMRWEREVCDGSMLLTYTEIAAIAHMRLAQVTLAARRAGEKEALVHALKLLMRAASLSGKLADPFALLGWTQECLADIEETQSGKEKCLNRAQKCYEKALLRNAAHELASSRLVHILQRRRDAHAVATVAENVTAKNPRAQWAWNHLAWAHMTENRTQKAVAAFQCALRGEQRVLDQGNTEDNDENNEEESDVFFGTIQENVRYIKKLLVIIDSWWGLAMAYKAQSKYGPAATCIGDSQRILGYLREILLVSTGKSNEKASTNFIISQQTCDLYSLKFETELAVLEQLDGQHEQAERRLRRLVESATDMENTPCHVYTYHCNALIDIAATQWLQGSFTAATFTRLQGARQLVHGILAAHKQAPGVNLACMYKQLGDMYLAVVTDTPQEVKQLLSEKDGSVISLAIQSALLAYSNAMRREPWKWNLHATDLGVALVRQALNSRNPAPCQLGLKLLTSARAPAYFIASALLALSELEQKEVQAVAEALLARYIAKEESIGSSKKRAVRNTDTYSLTESKLILAEICVHNNHIQKGAIAATDALKDDPLDTRAWLALARLRERDANNAQWPEHTLASVYDAYAEADRLGGGPVAVAGMLRSSLQKVLRDVEGVRLGEKDFESTFEESCYCAVLAARCGEMIPDVCEELRKEWSMRRFEDAEKLLQDAQREVDSVRAARVVRMYPFWRDIVTNAMTLLNT